MPRSNQTTLRNDELLAIDNDQAALDLVVGVEPEKGGDEMLPGGFDPRKIRMHSETLSLDTLLNRIRDGRIDLQPDFQRAAGVWDIGKKSRLIESLLVKIPLPSFYIDGSNDENWLIIDGLQRLTTLREFVVEKKLRLKGLEFLKGDEGKTFDELDRPLQRRIEETQVNIYKIQEGTPEEVKYNIFRRVNTGGSVLSAQEIRNALFQGNATVLVRELAASQEFQRATDRGVKALRMADREIVLRFLAFARIAPEQYTTNELETLMNNTMTDINMMSSTEIEELRQRFFRAMRYSHAILDRYAFRKIYPSGRRGVVNRALFDAWTWNIDRLPDSKLDILVRRPKTVQRMLKKLMEDVDFDASITSSTADPVRVKKRFGAIRKLLQEASK